MGEKIVDHVHKAYEYRLPLSEIPPEADEIWRDWLAPYVGCDAKGVHELIQRRFQGVSKELLPLSELVMKHTPFAILIFEESPLLWLENFEGEDRWFIYLPPEAEPQEVRDALKPYRLDSHELLVEFLALFGGMGDLRPYEEIEFAGRRRRGKTILEPATNDIEAGMEYLTDSEVQERRRLFTRWTEGVEVLNGGDGLYWHIGTDGTICEHECGDPEIAGVFDSFAEMIRAFVNASTPQILFNGAYDGLPGKG